MATLLHNNEMRDCQVVVIHAITSSCSAKSLALLYYKLYFISPQTIIFRLFKILNCLCSGFYSLAIIDQDHSSFSTTFKIRKLLIRDSSHHHSQTACELNVPLFKWCTINNHVNSIRNHIILFLLTVLSF